MGYLMMHGGVLFVLPARGSKQSQGKPNNRQQEMYQPTEKQQADTLGQVYRLLLELAQDEGGYQQKQPDSSDDMSQDAA